MLFTCQIHFSIASFFPSNIIGFPFINDAKDARRAVAACTYPPKGIRGCNPQRASYYGRMSYLDYVKNARNETLVMALIEQKSGYDNIEEIVQVEGIDMVALGPGDLSLDLGYGKDMTRPELYSMISNAAKICKQFHMPFFAFPAIEAGSVKTWTDIGADLLCFAQDTTFLTSAINQLWPIYEKVVVVPKEKQR